MTPAPLFWTGNVWHFVGQLEDLVLRRMGSDSLVVEYAPSVSGRETPVDFKFDAIHPAVPGTGALAEFRERRHPWRPRHCRDHRLASGSAGLSQLPCLGV